MSKDLFIQYIYNAIPEVQAKSGSGVALKSFISKFVDGLIDMYPAHATEITLHIKHGYQFREIGIYTIKVIQKLYEKPPTPNLATIDISPHLSRFLFHRLAPLTNKRTQNPDYPIHFLDTRTYSLQEHQTFMSKLSIFNTASLSMILTEAPGPKVLSVYAAGFASLPKTVSFIELYGLACDAKNASFVEALQTTNDTTTRLYTPIHLPEWDNAPNCGTKELYKILQRSIEYNIALAKANVAYQHFMKARKRNPSLWEPLLSSETPEWNIAYFELLHHDLYQLVSEKIIQCTQHASNLDEVEWMLTIGLELNKSSKVLTPLFIDCVVDIMKSQNQPKKQAFIQALFQTTTLGVALDHHSLWHLWLQWSTHRTTAIQTITNLAKLTIGLNTLQNQTEFNRYVHTKQQRLYLMKTLQQGSIYVDATLSQRCYKWYRTYLKQITFWVNWSTIELGKRQDIYRHAYQILANLRHELQMIMSPKSPTKPITPAKTSHTLRAHYAKIFATHEQCYAGFFWSCNRSRINQAQDLFKQLKAITAPNKKEYYEDVLTTLIQTQIAIFSKDKAYYLYAANQKGHSRLHDICTELFLTVTHDYLCDADLNEHDKASIQSQFTHQIKQHASLLAEQLAPTTSLSQKINQWQRTNGNITELQVILKHHPKNSINSKLHYLYRSLETMVVLPESILDLGDTTPLSANKRY